MKDAKEIAADLKQHLAKHWACDECFTIILAAIEQAQKDGAAEERGIWVERFGNLLDSAAGFPWGRDALKLWQAVYDLKEELRSGKRARGKEKG
jgi:hypothetical protein